MSELTSFIIALACALAFMLVVTWPYLKTQVRIWQLSRREQEALEILGRNKR